MADPIILDSLDGVPEPLKALAKEKGGKFELSIPEDRSEDVANLTSTSARLRREKKQAEDALALMREALTVDGETLSKDQIAELLEIRNKAAGNGNGNHDPKDVIPRSELSKLRKTWEDEWNAKSAKEKQVLADQIADLQGKYDEKFINGGIRALANAEGMPQWQPGALDSLIDTQNATKAIRMHEGEPVVWDHDNDRPMINKKTGENMTIADWALSIVAQRSYLIKESTGSGATQTNGKPATRGMKRGQMSVAEKSAFIGEHGFEKFMELPA